MKQFNNVTIYEKDKSILQFITYTIPAYDKGEIVKIDNVPYKIKRIQHHLFVKDNGQRIDTHLDVFVRKLIWGLY